jgi:hypothetical protein
MVGRRTQCAQTERQGDAVMPVKGDTVMPVK